MCRYPDWLIVIAYPQSLPLYHHQSQQLSFESDCGCELSESVLLDSVVVVSVAESEALLVNTEAVSDAVASVVLELVLEPVLRLHCSFQMPRSSLVVLSAALKNLSEVAEVLDSSDDVSLLVGSSRVLCRAC